MSPSDDFKKLMQDVLAGSDEAAFRLFRDYHRLVLAMIRRRLEQPLRRRFDSVDFAQDVWASFFATSPEKRRFEDHKAFFRFLGALAHNKVLDGMRQQFKAQKRDASREQSIDDSKAFNKDELRDPGPTPSKILMSEEAWSSFLRKQPVVHRRIFILRRQGMGTTEIAQNTGLNPRMVRRILKEKRDEAGQ